MGLVTALGEVLGKYLVPINTDVTDMSACGSLWRLCPCAHMHVAVIGLMDQDDGRHLT